MMPCPLAPHAPMILLTLYLLMITLYFREIRECLRLDPDHKECFPHYKVRTEYGYEGVWCACVCMHVGVACVCMHVGVA